MHHCRTSIGGPPILLKDRPLGPRAPQNPEPTPPLLPAPCVSAWSAQKIGHRQSVDREGSTNLTDGPTSWKTKERFLAASLVNEGTNEVIKALLRKYLLLQILEVKNLMTDEECQQRASIAEQTRWKKQVTWKTRIQE